MVNRYIPLALRHSPTPRIEHFALLAGLEAAVRGTLISAMPLAVYAALGTAQTTSLVYFLAGIVALIWGLMVPWATRFIPRRWAYTGGCLLYVLGMALAILGTAWSVPLALVCNAMATATPSSASMPMCWTMSIAGIWGAASRRRWSMPRRPGRSVP